MFEKVQLILGSHLSKFVGILLPHTGCDMRTRSGRGMGGWGAPWGACGSYRDRDREGGGRGQLRAEARRGVS